MRYLCHNLAILVTWLSRLVGLHIRSDSASKQQTRWNNCVVGDSASTKSTFAVTAWFRQWLRYLRCFSYGPYTLCWIQKICKGQTLQDENPHPVGSRYESVVGVWRKSPEAVGLLCIFDFFVTKKMCESAFFSTCINIHVIRTLTKFCALTPSFHPVTLLTCNTYPKWQCNWRDPQTLHAC